MLKRGKECDTYLTHVCKRHHSVENPVKKIKYIELSANTVAFITCRSRLLKALSYILSFHRFPPLQWCLQTWVRQVLYSSLLFNIFYPEGQGLWSHLESPGLLLIEVSYLLQMDYENHTVVKRTQEEHVYVCCFHSDC